MATKENKEVIAETPQNVNLLSLENDEREENIMSETEVKFERLKNTSKVKFLNTTPKAPTAKWDIVGRGITSNENNYGAKTTDEHWIIEENERHSLDGYSLGSDVEQTAIKGDGVFEFVDDLMYKMAKGSECETQMLEVYKYRVNESESTPKYDARLFNVLIVPDTDTIEGGSALKLKYKIQTQGDPKFGKVTFSNGTPTFTENE
jgi:hypothetical protein